VNVTIDPLRAGPLVDAKGTLDSRPARLHAIGVVVRPSGGLCILHRPPGLGAEFLVVTRGDLASFATAGHMASYAGLVPVPQDSGRVTGNLRRPKRYNRRLRRVFYLAALSSLRTSGPSRQFYDRKRGERLIHSQALLALARRLVDVLWALLRDGREFTPDRPNTATAPA
jgi:transposase